MNSQTIFQHLVFLAQSNTENHTDIAPVAATTVVPLGLYSSRHTQLSRLPDRAEIALPNDPANQGRALRVLEQAKVIELRPEAGLFATPDDITANPKHIRLTPVNATPSISPSSTAASGRCAAARWAA
ncbi:MetQ/NlpA family ABC transporter substrate-binding protein [Streptomyces sp. NPDC093093]|uniref:MetQ/NlpA family ABC transporter substrate-binding protein n=1 Tax=Streptomyces sp. NPDC093093 TaxID=3366025 RepID=UPI003811633E